MNNATITIIKQNSEFTDFLILFGVLGLVILCYYLWTDPKKEAQQVSDRAQRAQARLDARL